MSAFLALVRRDLTLGLRAGGGVGLGLAFFALMAVLAPFGVGPEPGALARIAPGMVWIAALLATLLTLDRLFQADFEDGSLDQMALGPLSLEAVTLAKCLAHFLMTGLALTLAAPIIALLLQMPAAGYGPMLGGLIIGTPALSLIGAVGAALTVGVRRGGLLISLLVLPLYAPTLIFGAGAIDAAVHGLSFAAPLALLGAISLGCLVLCPIAAAAALRLNLS